MYECKQFLFPQGLAVCIFGRRTFSPTMTQQETVIYVSLEFVLVKCLHKSLNFIKSIKFCLTKVSQLTAVYEGKRCVVLHIVMQ